MTAPSTEKVAVAGLGRLASLLLWAVGALAGGKGVWDFVAGQPEAGFFSPRPWRFVTQAQWARFAVFEFMFGLACVGWGWAVWVYSRRLPEWRERPL